MPEENQNKKDIWDIVSIVGSFLPTILLGIIPFIITDRITTSLETGRFTQSLIEDLASSNPEQNLRQDVALVALDRSVGCEKDDTIDNNERCILVAEIAEQIYINSLGANTPEEDKLKSISFQILLRRSPDRAEQLRRDSRTGAAAVQAANVQAIDPNQTATTASAPTASDLAASAIPTTVYLQFSPENNRPIVEELRNAIATKISGRSGQSINVPAIDLEEGNYQNTVRYFNAEDRDAAVQLKWFIEAFLREKNVNVSFQVIDFTQSRYAAPVGQLEVWLSF